MSIKVTMKAIQEDYTVLFHCPYGDQQLQGILNQKEPVFYTAGIYGWNNSIYIWQDGWRRVAICTGYRGCKGKEIPEHIKEKARNFDELGAMLWNYYYKGDETV